MRWCGRKKRSKLISPWRHPRTPLSNGELTSNMPQTQLSIPTKACEMIYWDGLKLVEGALKCNVDASIFTDTTKFRMEATVRDVDGLFISAQTSTKVGILSIAEFEASALLEEIFVVVWRISQKFKSHIVWDSFASCLYKTFCDMTFIVASKMEVSHVRV